MIDIRSDTVTRPSKGMYDAMLKAELGDDVFGEDPTVNLLQEKCAALTGKEKALFVPTGCMANQLAVKSHTNPGDEIICESEAHIFNYETAAPAVISQVQIKTIPGDYGEMNPEDIRKHIRTMEYYFPKTSLICLENTHNRAGGTILSIRNFKDINRLASERGIKIHLDGARIFNAMTGTGISVKEYASLVDSISFCFSKGLGCPVGSVLCGTMEFIQKAHKWRKILGGGMRQAGVLAAAALYALDNNIDRLKDDHKKAKFFAKEISELDGININIEKVHTNIVIFSSGKFPKNELIKLLKNKGLLISSGSYENLRAVFHLDVDMQDVYNAVGIFKSVFV
ncbi:MAG: low-specificity L-threonine aldolase [Ignavibacteria bacterium]|nr:low-specificity L-threonine aldolase [Ignavibacteria bacterium]